MNVIADKVLKHKKAVLLCFIISAIVCLFLKQQVVVNYNLADYLPDNAPSTLALEVMDDAYTTKTPNVRVYIPHVSVVEALAYKETLANVEGVESIEWLDDSEDVTKPLETLEPETVAKWYVDNGVLYSLTISEEEPVKVLDDIRAIIGDEGAMTGEAVTTAAAQVSTGTEIPMIMGFVIPMIFVVLLVTTSSWFEPVLFLVTIGISIALNAGTNIIFGEISFITNATSNILQLAVSMDYAIFLLHRFAEFRDEGMSVQDAMHQAMIKAASSIFSSGLTTFFGFIALTLMSFKVGPDMGIVLAKGIIFSLLSVLFFLPVLAMYTYKWIDKTHHRSFMPSFNKIAKLATRVRTGILVLVLVLVVPCFLAQQKTDFMYGSSGMNTPESQVGQEKALINETFGEANTFALMVPKGQWGLEKELSANVSTLPEVTSVLSIVDVVGSEIPLDYLPEDEASKLISEDYSRFIITAAVDEESEQTFEFVAKLREIAHEYYDDDYYLAGGSVSTYDIKETVTNDNLWVNLLAIGAIGVVLLVTFKSLSLPVLLLLTIEASIWINLSVPYYSGTSLNYIGYLVINSVQLGATVDYAILFAESYLHHRQSVSKYEAATRAITETAPSILTSGGILCIAGANIGIISTNVVISQLGVLIGRGGFISVILVLLFLPALLVLCDPIIEKTTLKTKFYREQKSGGVKHEIINA